MTFSYIPNYPSSLDDSSSLRDPGANDAPIGHAELHTEENQILRALEAKVGIGSSTPTAGQMVLISSAPGVTGWAALNESVIPNLTSDLAAKASLSSPNFGGTPTAPTAPAGTSTTQIATTAYVQSVLPAGYVLSVAGRSGNISLTESDIANLTTDLAAKYSAANPPPYPVTTVAGRAGAIVLAESDITNLTADLAATEKTANKGVANGYASLDSGGKVPTSQLPAAALGALQYQGSYNASGGTFPASPSKGYYWVISVAGTLGGTAYKVGDWLTYDGSAWDKIDNSQTVTSVAGRTGAIVLAESDITGLVSDLAAKATDTAVVHLANTETVTGKKTFNNDLTVGSAYSFFANFIQSDPTVSAEMVITVPNRTTTGQAGSVTLSAGAATAASSNGGDIVLQPGNGTAATGHVRIYDPAGAGQLLLDTSLLTTSRTVTFPDKAGTVAMTSDLTSKAPLASPAFTGTPTAPTPSAGSNNTQLATAAYVDSAAAGLQTQINSNTSNISANTTAIATKLTSSGAAMITVGQVAPTTPAVGDLWVDTN